MFRDFPNKKNRKRHIRYTLKAVASPERFNRTFKAILEKPVFGKSSAYRIYHDEVITKQCFDEKTLSN